MRIKSITRTGFAKGAGILLACVCVVFSVFVIAKHTMPAQAAVQIAAGPRSKWEITYAGNPSGVTDIFYEPAYYYYNDGTTT